MFRLPPVLLCVLPSFGCYPRLKIDLGAVGDGGAADGGSPDGGSPDGGADGGADGGGGDGGLGTLDVTSVTPADVPTSGGVEAEVLGGPFDDSAQVLFGERGGDLLSADKYRLEVVIPPSVGSATGPVDVTVRTDDAEGVLAGGVRYWPDVNGKAQVLGAWLQLDPVGGVASAPVFDAWLRLVEADDLTPVDRYGVDLDACGPPSDGVGTISGPDEVGFGYAGDLLGLSWDKERLEYVAAVTVPPPMTQDASLDLEVPSSGFSPALEIEGVALTPRSTLRLDSPDLGVGTPVLDQSAATLQWTPAGYDVVLITAGIGDRTLFLCPVRDTGSFTLTRDLFDGLDYTTGEDGGSSADIWLAVAGVVRTATDLVYSNGQVRVDVGFGEVGAVRIMRSPDGTTGGGR